MKRLLLFLIFSISLLSAAVAQGFAVQGRVVDAEKVTEVLPAATVRLLMNDTIAVAGVATDEKGCFDIKAKSAGKYLLEVSFVGCETKKKTVELTAKRPVVKVGDIKLERDVMLDELLVSGLAQELTIKADTFIYHANAFRVPEGSTIAALIKQLPGLVMDTDGKLTFQGKAVSSILVNGKPFIGDANTAMSNIVSEAVQDVAVYEKTDEEKDFVGIHDIDKATVIDLKIKKEYMTQWSVNLNAGAGTHDKYMAKAFASNFTDKRRTAVYAQVNNISENQTADENGNWQNNSWGLSGLYTYRKVGAIMSWDNGKANSDEGLFKFNGEVELGHDNSNESGLNNVEYLLGNAGSQFYYGSNGRHGRERDANVTGNITYNIDSLNRLTANISFRHDNNSHNGYGYTSIYSDVPGIDNPDKGLVGDEVPEDLKAMGINSQVQNNMSSTRSNRFRVDTRFLHRFRKEGYSLSAHLGYDISGRRNSSDAVCDYRYFNSDTPGIVDRRYTVSPNNSKHFNGDLELSGAFNESIRFTASYNYRYSKSDEANNIYRLDRYAQYAQPGLPLGVRPSVADSLLAVVDIANSLFSKRTELDNSLRLYLIGVWDKFEANVGATMLYRDERLDYERGGVSYSPSRTYFEATPMARVRWKPIENGDVSLQYYAYRNRPGLLEQLPITDTSNEMIERVNNTGLKDEWNNFINLDGHWFNEKRGDSYYLYVNSGLYSNSVVDIMQIDPATGKMRYTKDNVNGRYYLSFGGGTEQPLDQERHWSLSASGSYSINRHKSYVGAMGDALGLSVIYSYRPSANLRLKWRSGIWSLNFNGQYACDIARYDSTPEYDQDGHTFECSVQPQVDLPFGMKINTSFMLYGRRGYADEIMNHDQWLWNASISQSMLKNNALTLQLQAVDILHQRTAEYSSVSPQMRYFSRSNVFFSYVMLNAIYRFNIGGAKN